MTNLTRRQTFKYQLHSFLSATASANGVTVLKKDVESTGKPYVWIEIDEDNYDTQRDESGRVIKFDNTSIYKGECEFTVYGRVAVSNDTSDEDTLTDEAERVLDYIEGAVKYGGSIAQLTTSRYRLTIIEITPQTTAAFLDQTTGNGLVGVSGIIRYNQTDL